MRTEIQIEFLQSNWTALGHNMQVHQTQILDILQAKLVLSERDLAKVISLEDEETGHGKKVKPKRLKFALALKTCLEKTVNDMESWRDRFDPSWWLILRLKDPAIDQKLAFESSSKEALTVLKALRNEILAQENAKKPLPFNFIESSALLPEREEIEGSQSTIACVKKTLHYMVVDTVSCDPAVDPELTMKDIQDLARILANVEPNRFGFLSCFGAVKNQNSGETRPYAYDLLLKTPSNLTNPRGLRKVLESSSYISLNDRIELAVSLARAVLFLHAFHFVHKSIRPENIILLGEDDEQIGRPFLVGFEKFRLDTTSTHRYDDDSWEKNLYRHPQRQGIRPQEDFIMQHDVYSLGVVLLELGLGISFVHRPQGITEKDRPVPDIQLETIDLINPPKKYGQALVIKNKLIGLATAKLPSTFGRKYTEVVLSCLTCLDKGNARFGELRDLQDEDGICVGVRYVEKVSPTTNKYYTRDELTFQDSFGSRRHQSVISHYTIISKDMT